MKLVKYIGLASLLLLQSCSNEGSPFSPGISGDELRIGSGTGGSFVEGAIALASTTILASDTVAISVNIVDADGNLSTAANGTVAFSSTCVGQSLATIASASVDIVAGSAATTYTDQGCSTDSLSAIATLDDGTSLTATATLTVTSVVKIGSGTGAGFVDSAITFGSATIVSGGNTTVSVNIVDVNNALNSGISTVTFTSTCATASQATFTTPTVVTTSGTATTSYIDQGCVGSDFITASLSIGSGNISASGQLVIVPLNIGTGSGGGFVQSQLTLTPSAITEGQSSSVSVNIVDSTNALYTSPVSVLFSSGCASAATPTATFGNSTVTTASGTATTTYTDQGCSGTDSITATLDTVSAFDPVAAGNLSITAMRIGSLVGATFTANTVELGLTSLSAGGTTSVSVDIVDSADALITSPVTVNFESNCVIQGTASFDNASTSAVNGTATVTYTVDSGCVGTDNIRAKIDPFSNNERTAAADITIASPSVGSIQFTSNSVNLIALQGTGNTSGLPENATIIFTILDNTGNPISGETVNFALNTSVGGITLQNASNVSDAQGKVQTILQSGTVATSVRVTATVASNTALTTQSGALTISTGLPDHDSFSLSAETLNPQAWNHDGVTTEITARLADRFNNPIQDGTSITFTTELGSIESFCITAGGACSVTWTSQSPRGVSGPGTNAGRTTILATVIGEESFIDVNGNGIYDDGDGTANFTDLPEAFRDDDEDGTRDNSEPFVDFNSSGTYNGVDGLFNGVQCTHSTECSPTGTLSARDSLTLIMAEDIPRIVRVTGAGTGTCDNTDGVTGNDCYDDGVTTIGTNYPTGAGAINVSAGSSTLTFTIVGSTNYQVLPVGTEIEFTADNGEIVTGASQTVLNTSANTYDTAGNPTNLSVAQYSVTIQTDGTTSADGNLIISVTPGGGSGTEFTFGAIPISD